MEIQYSGGVTEKLNEHFESPEHAINVIRRMLHVSGMVLDDASPDAASVHRSTAVHSHWADAPKTVSYTHLDVYKRQPQREVHGRRKGTVSGDSPTERNTPASEQLLSLIHI